MQSQKLGFRIWWISSASYSDCTRSTGARAANRIVVLGLNASLLPAPQPLLPNHTSRRAQALLWIIQVNNCTFYGDFASGNDLLTPATTRKRHARQDAGVPQFALYGEDAANTPRLHIEDIQERSRLYRWDINAHLHGNLYQLVCVLSGPVEVDLDAAQHIPTAPVVVIVPSGTVHAFRFAPETEGYVLTLHTHWANDTELELDEACRTLFAAPRLLALDADNPGSVDALLRELRKEFRQPDGPQSPVTGWLARAVIWRLAQRVSAEGAGMHAKNPQHALFTRFRLLIEDHYAEHWSVAKYARLLNLTVERLNRICKQQANITAFEFVQQRVLQEACRRLIYIVAPVSQLAYELGFADAAYFCRFFKRRTGLSPNQYRKRHGG